MDILPLLSIEDLTIKGGITWLNSWAPLSAMAVIAALLIHLTLLMIARAFSIKEFENYASAEILQAIANAVMIGALILMINSALDLAHGVIAGDIPCSGKSMHIGTTNQSTMDEAFDAIRCKIQSRAVEIANIQSEVTTGVDAWNSFNQINVQGSIMGLTFLKGDWIGSLYRETETIRITNNLATVLLIGLNALSSVFAYVKANALTMFIPLGILFRSFYFTRSVGAFFLALGIGAYFIFPVFYVLLDPGFIASSPTSGTAQAAIVQPYCYATMSNTVTVLQTLQAGGLGTTSIISKEAIRDELSKSYVELMLHPLVAFFLTMIFIRYIMSVLGADAYELVRMVGKVV